MPWWNFWKRRAAPALPAAASEWSPQPGTFAFRVRFHLPQSTSINIAEKITPLPAWGGCGYMRLSAAQGDSIDKARRLAVRGGGFASEVEARAAGERMRSAISFAGAVLGVGFDVGRYPLKSWIYEAGLKAFTPPGTKVRNDIHGVDVFNDEPNLIFLSGRADAVVGKNGPKFVEELGRAFESDAVLYPKLSLALELYGLSHFEASQRARFLMLVSVVESVAVQGSRSIEVRAFLDGCIEAAKSKFAGEDASALRNGLGHLKSQSIGGSCRQLVAQHIGADAAKEFKRWYDVRSTLVHDGEIKGVDFGSEAPRLDGLVAKLLVALALAAKASQRK